LPNKLESRLNEFSVNWGLALDKVPD